MPLIKTLIGLILLLTWSGAGIAATLDDTRDGVGGIQCDAGLWCEHDAGQCNVADAAGNAASAQAVVNVDRTAPVAGLSCSASGGTA